MSEGASQTGWCARRIGFPNFHTKTDAPPKERRGWRAGRALPGRSARVGRGRKKGGPGKGSGRTKEKFS